MANEEPSTETIEKHLVMILENQKCKPAGASVCAWLCLILGSALIYFWPVSFVFYVPFIVAAFLLSLVAIAQRRAIAGFVVLLLTIVVPFGISASLVSNGVLSQWRDLPLVFLQQYYHPADHALPHQDRDHNASENKKLNSKQEKEQPADQNTITVVPLEGNQGNASGHKTLQEVSVKQDDKVPPKTGITAQGTSSQTDSSGSPRSESVAAKSQHQDQAPASPVSGTEGTSSEHMTPSSSQNKQDDSVATTIGQLGLPGKALISEQVSAHTRHNASGLNKMSVKPKTKTRANTKIKAKDKAPLQTAYSQRIEQEVIAQWDIPVVNHHVSCTVRIFIMPKGAIIAAMVMQGCQQPAVRRSVMNAVRNAQPLAYNKKAGGTVMIRLQTN